MQLLLFGLDDGAVAAAAAAGVDGVVVDLEQQGKHARQMGFDTDVSSQTLEDVRRIRALTDLPLVVRVDGPGPDLVGRIEAARSAGADEVLIPMVADADAVSAALRAAPADLPVGVLVERVAAVDDIDRIAGLPLARLYVGLMDLMVERRSSTPFAALVDGTVERVRRATGQAFGVAGLTAPGFGHPVAARLLAAELVRLRTDFTFLRRSFYAAAATLGLERTVQEIRGMIARLERRSPAEVEHDRRAFCDLVLAARS